MKHLNPPFTKGEVWGKWKSKMETEEKIKAGVMPCYFVILLFCCIVAFSYGAFQDPGWSARAEGMGGVFCARGLDATTVLYNPAGLENLKSAEAVFMGFKPYMGMTGVDWNYYLLSGAVPTGKFTIGFAYAGYNAQSVYGENTFLISASSKKGALAFGGSLKYLEHNYKLPAQMSPLFGSSGASAFTIDLGGAAEISERVSAGISAQNLFPADVGIKYEDKVPLLIRSGICIKERMLGPFSEALLELDVDMRSQNWGDKMGYSIGAEGWLARGRVGLRTGYNAENFNLGASYVFVAGRGNMELDYSFSLPLEIKDNAGSHRIQLVWRFSAVFNGFESQPPEKREAERRTPKREKLTPITKRVLMKGYLNRAADFYGAGRYEDAINEWEKILEIDPSDEISRAKIEKAKDVLERGESKTDSAKKVLYFNRGTEFYKQGQYEKAIAEWEKVLEIDPGHILSREKIEKAKKKLSE